MLYPVNLLGPGFGPTLVQESPKGRVISKFQYPNGQSGGKM